MSLILFNYYQVVDMKDTRTWFQLGGESERGDSVADCKSLKELSGQLLEMATAKVRRLGFSCCGQDVDGHEGAGYIRAFVYFKIPGRDDPYAVSAMCFCDIHMPNE